MTIRDLIEIGGITIQRDTMIAVFDSNDNWVSEKVYPWYELPLSKVIEDGYADLDIIYIYPEDNRIVFEVRAEED